jgi:hypothetical protein
MSQGGRCPISSTFSGFRRCGPCRVSQACKYGLVILTQPEMNAAVKSLSDHVGDDPNMNHLIRVRCAACGRSLGLHVVCLSEAVGEVFWRPYTRGEEKTGEPGRVSGARPEIKIPPGVLKEAPSGIRGPRRGRKIQIEKDGDRRAYWRSLCECRANRKLRADDLGGLEVRLSPGRIPEVAF